MIQYINHLLNQWGMWCRSGRESLGYPKHAAFLNGQPQKSGSGALVICDEQALQVQRAVNALDKDLKKLVVLFYVKMRSCDGATIAREMRYSRDTMYVRLHIAHLRVMDAIHDDELNA